MPRVTGARWARTAPGRYADTVTEAVIERDGRLWRRTGGGSRSHGWYPTLAAAQGGSAGRQTWRRVTATRWDRIDGWSAISGARQGAPRCWRLRGPDGAIPGQASGGRGNLFGSRLAAMRAAPKLTGESRGGREPRRRPPDPASRASERSTRSRKLRKPTFAELALAAARSSETGRLGDRLVLINHVHRAYRRRGGKVPLTTFKRRLVAAQRRGELLLAAADMPQLHDPIDVRRSLVTYRTSPYHFVRIPPEGGA